ncbi:FAD-dependent monooxygenase [Paraburkholderia sp. J63]|uniref:FAD-dependent monooxygenase n=1 Tax=Paraburkholderia sp. J63 TaxID=2805434 RepID=UPI002ABDFE2D|nr:FAD-dependent monooxygenase [Paraburkholderia sp. J63]
MSNPRKVLVIGAGIGGLAAGALLAQKGIEVDIVEIRPDSNVLGIGINQPANSLRVLERIGVLDEICDAGFQYAEWRYNDQDGKLIASCPSNMGDDGIPANNALARKDLHSILIGAATRAGVNIRYGLTIDTFDSLPDRVEVTLTDGVRASYDLVVAFDGVNSAIRRQLFGTAYEPVYTGYSVWRVLAPRPRDITCINLFQSIGAKAGVIPLSEDWMYLLNVTPEPEVRYRQEDFVEMLRERLQTFGGLVGEIRDQHLKADSNVVYSPLKECMLPEPWFKGRVVVCGDAAHACSPHLTQGAAMALEDAMVLAEELVADRSRSVEHTLGVFMRRRYPRARFVQDASHQILADEMAVTADNLAAARMKMVADLPRHMAAADAFLNQPA